MPDHTPALAPPQSDVDALINRAGRDARGPVMAHAAMGAMGGSMLGALGPLVGISGVGGGAMYGGGRKLAQLARRNPALQAYILRRLGSVASGAGSVAGAAEQIPKLGVGAYNR